MRKVMNFEQYKNQYGDKIYEEVLDWLENVPEGVDLRELLGCDTHEYAYGVMEESYENYVGNYDDQAYDEMRDRDLEEDYE